MRADLRERDGDAFPLAEALRVLLIEDNPGDARLIREMLADAPESVTLVHAGSLAAGIEHLQVGDIDVVLLDLGLPDASGLTAPERIQTCSPHLPVVILSGVDDRDLAVSAVQAGVQDYLLKGHTDRDELVRALMFAIERKRMQDAQRFLANTGHLLAESLDLDETLKRVARLAIPFLADGCILDLHPNDGMDRTVIVAHTNPVHEALIEQMRQRYGFGLSDGEHPGWRAQEEHKTILLSEVPDSLLEAVAEDAVHLQLMRQVRASSVLIVPLIARGHSVGVLTMLTSGTRRRFTLTDQTIAEELALGCALAIDNARLHRELARAVRQRDELIGFTSHDLKNPLAALQLVAEVLSLRLESPGAVDAATQQQHVLQGLRRIREISAEMYDLIEAMLDVSRMQAGRPLGLNPRRIEAISLIREVIGAQRRRDDDGNPIELIVSELELSVFWDPDRMRRVIDNLLNNACKYSARGAPVTVSVTVDDDTGPSVSISFRDEGIGIPAAEVQRVFERFYRASNAENRTHGTGLGLAGARQVVEEHGGTIRVASRERHGSTFTVRLPRNAPVR
jgi:signal transduction histidine kinase